MKKDFIIFLFLSLLFIPALTYGQENKINRAYLGVYGNYLVPVFEFQKLNYKAGTGISISYLSRKLPVFKDLPYSLRIGATAGVSGQGYRKFDITFQDSLQSAQRFSNNFSYLTLVGRFTFEKKKYLKPYLELSFGLGNFSSEESFSNKLIYYDPSFDSKSRAKYNDNMFVCGISAGYLLQVTDWFMVDAKITYYQGMKKTAFADLDQFSFSTPYYQHTRKEAVPSLITAHLGLLFRIPRIGLFISAPEPGPRPSNVLPEPPAKKTKENKNPEFGSGSESSPKQPTELKQHRHPNRRRF